MPYALQTEQEKEQSGKSTQLAQAEPGAAKAQGAEA
jgi:hypothetical protein